MFYIFFIVFTFVLQEMCGFCPNEELTALCMFPRRLYDQNDKSQYCWEDEQYDRALCRDVMNRTQHCNRDSQRCCKIYTAFFCARAKFLLTLIALWSDHFQDYEVGSIQDCEVMSDHVGEHDAVVSDTFENCDP